MRQPNPNLCPKNAQEVWNGSLPVSTQVTVECELITPMYGGGVKAGVVDRNMPIRASALRGQLRFWWRLLNSTTYPKSKDLFNAESALWGGISSIGPKASQVTLQVKAEPVSSQDLIASSNDRSKFDYVLILDKKKKENPKLLQEGYKFKLILSFNSTMEEAQKEEVIEALRWWASFGGVGARTRRGLGAVKVTSNLACVSNPVSCQEVGSKNGVMVLRNPTNDAVAAWRCAINKLKNFRQGVGVGRDSSRHSRWPEPKAIRRLAKRQEKNQNDYYPRAAFGLPIVFQNNPTGTLEPNEPDRDKDRMASPLILRPYFDSSKYRSLALLLPGWEECVSVPVRFDSKPQGEAWPIDSTDRSTQTANVKPIKMNGPADNALSAFLKYFKK